MRPRVNAERSRPEFAGEFETHVTLGAGCGDAVASWAGRHAIAYTRIVLDRGRVPEQPMLTLRGHGTLSTQLEAAHACVAQVRAAGFEVVRVKIEAAPWNADVPRTAADAAALPADCHFEHHVKLLLADDAELALLREVAARHGARVSRNARRERADLGAGAHERFATQRCHAMGRDRARRRLHALTAALAAAGWSIAATEE
ncbi:MAG: hypothetical protein HOV68_24745, partial [Streptomycetaceae bacterium]|nr:hypothetical protein [Streptomycetaceae bacterium]